MITISLCMIVKNEEQLLRRCLNSAKSVADEIIIVDTGSEDQTKQIAREFTDRVYDFEWIDDFAAARNFSFSKATMEFCMWLDADDVLLPEEAGKLKALKEALRAQDADIVMLPYHVAYNEEGDPSFTYYRERLIRTGAGLEWQGAVHEAITPRGKILYGNAAVCHKKEKPGDPNRNLRIFERMLAEGKPLSPRHRYYYGRELYYQGQYNRAQAVLEDFLQQGGGWVENEIEACQLLFRCALAQGRGEEALGALLYSFRFDAPRAEICCCLGEYFLTREQYTQAIYWYEQALLRPMRRDGFVEPDSYGYLPCIQLCVCYDRIGETEKAREYNERAAKFHPQSAAVEYNRNYFASLCAK